MQSAPGLIDVVAMNKNNSHGTSIDVDLFNVKSERFYAVCVHGSKGFVDLQRFYLGLSILPRM